MIFNVDDSIIRRTTRCEKNLSCMSEQRNELCKITRNVEDKVYFVKCQENESCSYRLSFGDSFICNCPVRKEIYNKYHV